MPASRPTEIRFAEKYRVNLNTGCWDWTGSKSRGYGYIREARGGMLLAHKFSYEHHIACVPAGKIVRHSCNNSVCVNPDHLRIGTHADNMIDMAMAGTRKGKSGERTYLSDDQRELVVDDLGNGKTVSEVARAYQVDRKTIRNIRNTYWV
jgi:hypothetical protein